MSITTTYDVSGMTCAHCVSAVTGEVGRLTGVSDVRVDLRPDGPSRVTVVSAGPLPLHAVRAAIDEAGYELRAAP